MELNHVAVFVDNLEKATLGPALGGWAGEAISISAQPVIVNGRPAEHSGRTRRIRTANPAFGVSVEDVAPGAPIQPIPGHAWHHVAVWCDDILASVHALEESGYTRDIVGRGPNGKLATFAYMISDSGPRLELADAAIRSRFLQHAAEQQERADAAGQSRCAVLSAPLLPDHVTAVVETMDDLEALTACWRQAFKAEWEEVVEEAITVITVQGARELRTCRIRTLGYPYLAILVPSVESRALLAPVGGHGWHHVGFRTGNLALDVALLEASGFRREFFHQGRNGQIGSFAMMVAPEGTRIRLLSA